jgi:hypothetical protein
MKTSMCGIFSSGIISLTRRSGRSICEISACTENKTGLLQNPQVLHLCLKVKYGVSSLDEQGG